MDCPVCEKAMVVLELEQVEIDYCTACGGIWLDGGELELILDNSAGKDALLSSLREINTSTEKKIKCPICLKKMTKVLCPACQGDIQIDKCKNNHGIWFDNGELKAILEKGTLDTDNRVVNLLKGIFANSSR